MWYLVIYIYYILKIYVHYKKIPHSYKVRIIFIFNNQASKYTVK